MSKIKIHIRNNHWKEGFLPCDLEGEKHSTIKKEEFIKNYDKKDTGYIESKYLGTLMLNNLKGR